MDRLSYAIAPLHRVPANVVELKTNLKTQVLFLEFLEVADPGFCKSSCTRCDVDLL